MNFYDALNRRTQMTRPNNVTTNYSYDKLSRLLSVLHQNGASTIDGATYTMDAAGNRTAKTDQLAGVTSNYGYDPIYELTQVMQAANTTESYSYDAVGNRTASLGMGTYTTNASNEMTAVNGALYGYDNNGNTVTKTTSTGTTNYTWDFENRLTSVTLPGSGGTVSFKYDPFGRRIYKSYASATSVFAYDGNGIVETTNQNGAVLSRFTQGRSIDEALAESNSGTTSYYEADGLNSITSLSNSAGQVAQSYTYDSFGKQTASAGSLTNSFLYTGREFDTETNLYYYRNRYVDPAVGRFPSEDLFRFKVGINFYSYALNSPVNYIDPLGLQPPPKSWYDWWGFNWVPLVAPVKCTIWSHYCLKVTKERKLEELAHPSPYTNEEESSGRGDEGQRQHRICTEGDDNCTRLENECGGPILGLIFKTGAFPPQ